MSKTDEVLKHGPLRRAPAYYIGEHVGKYVVVRPDVERHQNGALPGTRDKHARRLIRAAFLRSKSSIERGLRNVRAMKAQAFEIAKDEKKSHQWARRLFAKELAIHQAVFVPDARKARTEKRKAKRRGEKDAIAKLVERIAKFGGKP